MLFSQPVNIQDPHGDKNIIPQRAKFRKPRPAWALDAAAAALFCAIGVRGCTPGARRRPLGRRRRNGKHSPPRRRPPAGAAKGKKRSRPPGSTALFAVMGAAPMARPEGQGAAARFDYEYVTVNLSSLSGLTVPALFTAAVRMSSQESSYTCSTVPGQAAANGQPHSATV